MNERRSRKTPHPFQFNVAQFLKQPSGTRRVYDIDTFDLPPLGLESPKPRATESDENPLDGTFDQIEREALLRALGRAKGNKTEAAKLLGLKRTTFMSRLQKQGIE